MGAGGVVPSRVGKPVVDTTVGAQPSLKAALRAQLAANRLINKLVADIVKLTRIISSGRFIKGKRVPIGRLAIQPRRRPPPLCERKPVRFQRSLACVEVFRGRQEIGS